MKKLTIFLLSSTLLIFSCRKDNRIRLFEIAYPNTFFDLPAGLSYVLPRVFEVPAIRSNYEVFRKSSGFSAEQVQVVSPLSATITALDPGLRYDFLREVSVRICPIGNDPCTPADEVFYIDRIQRIEDDRIQLLPTLRNVKSLISSEFFKLEVVFFLETTSPYYVESKLDMVFEATQ
jgi:hypothetical protein